MAWIATKRQKIKRDGQYIEVQPGSEVPEAEFWPNQQAHVDMGYIRWIPRDYVQPVKDVTTKIKTEFVEVKTEPVVEEKSKKRGRPKRKKDPDKDPATFFEAKADE
jgi:hypothetical protein